MCPACGSRYRVITQRLSVRQSGKAVCERCKCVIRVWNDEACEYAYELIEEPESQPHRRPD